MSGESELNRRSIGVAMAMLALVLLEGGISYAVPSSNGDAFAFSQSAWSRPVPSSDEARPISLYEWPAKFQDAEELLLELPFDGDEAEIGNDTYTLLVRIGDWLAAAPPDEGRFVARAAETFPSAARAAAFVSLWQAYAAYRAEEQALQQNASAQARLEPMIRRAQEKHFGAIADALFAERNASIDAFMAMADQMPGADLRP